MDIRLISIPTLKSYQSYCRFRTVRFLQLGLPAFRWNRLWPLRQCLGTGLSTVKSQLEDKTYLEHPGILRTLEWILNRLVCGKNYRKTPYLMGKSMVSCKFSLKPIHWNYHLVMTNSSPWKDPPMLLIGKPPINGPFSMAMLNKRRVYIYICIYMNSQYSEMWEQFPGIQVNHDDPYASLMLIC